MDPLFANDGAPHFTSSNRALQCMSMFYLLCSNAPEGHVDKGHGRDSYN